MMKFKFYVISPVNFDLENLISAFKFTIDGGGELVFTDEAGENIAAFPSGQWSYVERLETVETAVLAVEPSRKLQQRKGRRVNGMSGL